MDQEAHVFNSELDRREHRLHELREEMVQTRSSLAGKLETIHDRLQNTVGATHHAVEDTVHDLHDDVEAVFDMLNVRTQTECHPWTMIGLAVASGVVMGYCASTPRAAAQETTQAVPAEPARDAERAPSRPGLFAEEWNQVKKLAIGVGMALMRDWIRESVRVRVHGDCLQGQRRDPG